MTIRSVIDTNIWISSLINPFGFPAKIRKSFEKGAFKASISTPMLEELSEVLNRPRIKTKYKISDNDIKELLILIEERTEPVLLTGNVNICRDKDDNFVLETAIKGKVEFLVTRDDDIKSDKNVSLFLRKYGVSVVTIAKFLTYINKAK